MAMLLDITKDEATVADNVTKYTRSQVTEEVERLSKSLEADVKALEEARATVARLEPSVAADQEKFNLMSALLSEFDKRFPEEASALLDLRR